MRSLSDRKKGSMNARLQRKQVTQGLVDHGKHLVIVLIVMRSRGKLFAKMTTTILAFLDRCPFAM